MKCVTLRWSWSSDSSTGGSSRSFDHSTVNNNSWGRVYPQSFFEFCKRHLIQQALKTSYSLRTFLAAEGKRWFGDSDLKSWRCSWECKDIWAMWASLRRCLISSHFWLNSNFLHCQWFGGVVLHCFKVNIPQIPRNNSYCIVIALDRYYFIIDS